MYLTIFICMNMCRMGSTLIKRYASGLGGGIGPSAIGSNATYSPKEVNKEVMPEKVT